MARKAITLCGILVAVLAWISGSAFGQVDEYQLGTEPRDRNEEQVAAHVHHALRGVLGIGDEPGYAFEMLLVGPYSDLLDIRKVEASAEALAKKLDADAIPFLKRLVQDNESTRKMRYRLALMTLAKLPEDLGTPEVFCDLIVANPETRTDPLLVVSYMNPEAAQTVLNRLAAEHDDPLFRSISLDTIVSFNRRVREVFGKLQRSHGELANWVDPWSLDKPADELAAAFGGKLAPFLAEIATAGSGEIERPLALMTLAKLASHPQAAELLYNLAVEERRMPLSVAAAISFTDPEAARPLLERLAAKWHREQAHAVSLLVLMGDNQSYQVLRKLIQEWQTSPMLLTPSTLAHRLSDDPDEEPEGAGMMGSGGYRPGLLEDLEQRLSVNPEDKPEEWRRQELLHWQAWRGGGIRPQHVGSTGYMTVACRLKHHRLRFTREFLRSKPPSRLVLAILSVEEQAWGKEELERIARGDPTDGPTRAAQRYLEQEQIRVKARLPLCLPLGQGPNEH